MCPVFLQSFEFITYSNGTDSNPSNPAEVCNFIKQIVKELYTISVIKLQKVLHKALCRYLRTPHSGCRIGITDNIGSYLLRDQSNHPDQISFS
jgi:hypothetical protein